MGKNAVLLLNLGSPDSTDVADVRRYLKEFLLDERVIDSSSLVRKIVVNCFILPFRPKRSAEAYSKVWLDEGSPLIVTSKNQQTLLQEKQADTPIELAMRYGTPSIPDAIAKLKKEGIKNLFIVPLYPHYAMSSYETVVVKVMQSISELNASMKTTLLQPFYNDPAYIDALVASAQPYLDTGYDKLLFSFHGIPERHLRKSDPSHAHCLTTPNCCETCHPAHSTCYKHQCVTTAKKFAQKAGIPKNKYFISFQSRLGRDPWIKPYTDHVLEDFPKQGVKNLKVICPAFVSDCLETLEEISMEGKEDFLKAGGEAFEQIPCMNEHAAWIEFLHSKVKAWLESLQASETSNPNYALESTDL